MLQYLRRRWLAIIIVIVGTAPLWVWGLDSLLHFGYGGDR